MASTETETRQSYLVFACGSSWYAVPAECAAEVVRSSELGVAAVRFDECRFLLE